MVEITWEELVSALKSINGDPEIALNGRLQQVKVNDKGKIFQFRTIDQNPKRELSPDVFQKVIEYEDKGVADIMKAINVGKRSAKITYYRFAFNVLEGLNYHFIDKNGSKRSITLNYYCDAINAICPNRVRRASLHKSSVERKTKEDSEIKRKCYKTSDRLYRFAHLDTDLYLIDGSELQSVDMNNLKYIYNDIKRQFISI